LCGRRAFRQGVGTGVSHDAPHRIFPRRARSGIPPEKIDKDTTLNILAKDSGYAYVRLPDNRTGYVAFSDLRAAPPVAPGVPFDPVIVEEVVEVPLPDFGVMPDEIPEKLRKK
jgi:hypothetical protein